VDNEDEATPRGGREGGREAGRKPRRASQVTGRRQHGVMQAVGLALEAAREQGDETGREKVSCVVCSLPVVARDTGDARCDGSKHNL